MIVVRRFLLALSAAVAVAVFVLLYPRTAGQPGQKGPELTGEGVQQEVQAEPEVPWPSPPSAGPLTSQAPPVLREPEEPRAAMLFAAINVWRNDRGLKSVVLDDTLTAVAQIHASDMAHRSYLDHVTPEGVTFQMRIDASGYSYSSAAENLGFASHVDLIFPDWIRSHYHRVNIENGDFRRIGIATAVGEWQGIDVVYAATVFAAP